MIIVYDELRLIVNLGPGQWSLIECQEMEAQNEETQEKKIVPVIMYVFGGGMGKPVPYASAEDRDKHFDWIKKAFRGEMNSPIVGVGLQPRHPAAGMIQRR